MVIYQDENGVNKTKLAPASELIDTGLLWLINRAVFHPRGYALGIDHETNMWELWGNGDEPWSFDPETDDSKFLQVEEFLAKLRDFPEGRGLVCAT